MYPLCWLSVFVGLVSSQYLLESSSFGHGERISPNNYGIPGWHVSGEGQVPQLLSDKVILTPLYPGNTRGALWSESRVTQSEWVASLEFRASGEDRGGGNLQIWYARDGRASVGTSSIYTVGQFDGLVLVIDSYGGRGGGIRGFMNDGSTDYKNHHAVDSLAFGHCDYAYRNLGRPSRLQIKQNSMTFEVSIDGRVCFSSDKIRLPSDYHFGVTSASAENPDSFEAYKFLVYTASSVTREEPRRDQPPPQNTFQQGNNIQKGEGPSDTSASSYTSSDAQFEDLHNRLQVMSHSIDALFREVSNLAAKSESRHGEVARNLVSADKLNAMDRKLDSIDQTIRNFQGQFSYLQTTLKDHHTRLAEGLPKHLTEIVMSNGPRMGLMFVVFVVVQIAIVGAYTLYQRRIKQGPKKYL